MISRSLYLQLFVRVLLLAIAAMGLAWILFGAAANLLALVPGGIMVLVILNTVFYLNRVNRRIYFFFDAIKNEDASLGFPSDGHAGIEKDLSLSLLEVNKQIQRIYSENQKQEHYFQALIEQAATGMFTYNSKGFVLHSNHHARQQLGLDPFTHLSQLETIDPRLHQMVREIQPGQEHLTALIRENEVVQLLIKASAFQSDGGDLMLLSVQDIRNELDKKEIESWRKLIQVMRHEIMNSVTPITSLSESLRGYFQTDGKLKVPGQIDETTIKTTLDGLELIHDQARGLNRFVESYQQLTRMPEPEKKQFPVRKLLDDIGILTRSFTHAEKTGLVLECEPEDLKVLADEKQISQVLLNLVKNAYQATAGKEDAQVNINSGLNSQGRPQITVSDNGPGIPEDLIDKIFIPFFTTKEDGSGIGLSLSRQIMQMHGGSLELHSVPGEQTSVMLRF